MSTTIDSPTDNGVKAPSARRPTHRREDVVRSVEELAALGLKRDEIARELGMVSGCRGSLYMALRRAGRADLWRAIKPPDNAVRFDAQPIRQEASRILAALPAEDPEDVEIHRQELLEEPVGRRVRGRAGVVRWVA